MTSPGNCQQMRLALGHCNFDEVLCRQAIGKRKNGSCNCDLVIDRKRVNDVFGALSTGARRSLSSISASLPFARSDD
jgi:hypothetical protein